eukprot:7300255-Prymnesium_polylepis.1
MKTKKKRVSWAVPTPPRSMQDAAEAVKRVGQSWEAFRCLNSGAAGSLRAEMLQRVADKAPTSLE